MYFGNNDGDGANDGDGGPRDPGADGIAFVLQTQGADTVGHQGGGLGLSGINQSLGVEFDTYQNRAQSGDPEADHVVLIEDGKLVQGRIVDPIELDFNLEDGTYHNVTIAWTSVDRTIEVSINGTQILYYSGLDLTGILGGDFAYLGFTASTGDSTNVHEVCINSIQGTLYDAETPSTTPSSTTSIAPSVAPDVSTDAPSATSSSIGSAASSTSSDAPTSRSVVPSMDPSASPSSISSFPSRLPSAVPSSSGGPPSSVALPVAAITSAPASSVPSCGKSGGKKSAKNRDDDDNGNDDDDDDSSGGKSGKSGSGKKRGLRRLATKGKDGDHNGKGKASKKGQSGKSTGKTGRCDESIISENDSDDMENAQPISHGTLTIDDAAEDDESADWNLFLRSQPSIESPSPAPAASSACITRSPMELLLAGLSAGLLSWLIV